MSDNPPDFAGIDSFFTGNFVPEPGTGALFALGMVWLTGWHRRRSRVLLRG